MKALITIVIIFVGLIPNVVAANEITPLKSLIDEALQNNPEIKAARARWEASTKRPSQEGTLPDPVFGLSWQNVRFKRITLTEDPDSMIRFSFSQEIPFPGKLSLKEKIAEEQSQAQEKSYDAIQRRVIADLKEAYYDWYLVNKSIEITVKNKELITGFVSIAEAKYEVGGGIQQDVLKAQVELSRLLEQLEILKGKNGAVEARIKSILNRPPDSLLGNPENLDKTAVSLSTDELERLAEESAPLLKMKREMIESEEQSLALARKEFYPDFVLGISPGIMGRPDTNSVQGVWEVTLGIKVPLYFWRKERLGVEEAALELQAAKEEYSSTRQALLFSLKDKYLSATTSERLIDLYREGIIPQSRLSLESAISGYQVGDIDFLTLLDSLVTLFNFEIEYHRQLAEYHKALARLEEITGVDLMN